MASRLEKKLVGITQPVRRRLRWLFRRRKRPEEVYGLLSDFLSSNGKLLRPALCISSCLAVGGRAKDAMPAAAAIELFHNFTLIHDDIEDSSEMRRGKPCLHVKYGLPLALNAGDGLFMMVWRETLRISRGERMGVQLRLLSAFTKVLEGQAVELGWYRGNRWDVGAREYYQVVGGKTGALIAVSCEVGGLIGGADAKTCRALSRFGRKIGVGFQIVDDALNIVGEERKYGKEIGGDVGEGKRTLITIHALRMLPLVKKKRLLAILKKTKKTRAEVQEAVGLLRESGAVGKVLKIAENLVGAAIRELPPLPKNRGAEFLRELADYITKREK